MEEYDYLHNMSPTSKEKPDYGEMLRDLTQEESWFCAQPFINMYVSNYGLPHPCSNTTVCVKKHISTLKLDQIWNEPELHKLREEMVHGHSTEMIETVCTRCIETETNGYVSTRMHSNKSVQNDDQAQKELERLVKFVSENKGAEYPIPNVVHTIRIKTWGNYCNLQCLMCSPEDSSGVAKELMEIGEMSAGDILLRSEQRANMKMPWTPPLIYHSDHNVDMEDFWNLVKRTKRIQLIGGETWLIKPNVRILEKCVEEGWAKDITIFCFSNNFGHPNMDYILDLLSQFKSVIYKCSLELWGEKNNYIRYPSDWNEVYGNMIKISKMPNVQIGFNPTINPINAGYADELLKGAMEFGVEPSFMHIGRPSWFTLKSVPEDIKNHHLDRLYNNSYEVINKLSKVIDYLEQAQFDEYWYHHMIGAILKRDQNRGDSILNNFPEWKPHFERIAYYRFKHDL